MNVFLQGCVAKSQRLWERFLAKPRLRILQQSFPAYNVNATEIFRVNSHFGRASINFTDVRVFSFRVYPWFFYGSNKNPPRNDTKGKPQNTGKNYVPFRVSQVCQCLTKGS